MKHLKLGVGLGVLLLALGGLATWDEWQTKKDEKDKESKNQVLAFKTEEVQEIEIRVRADGDNAAADQNTSAGESVFNLKKIDEKWTIESPIQSLADQQTIQDLLKNVSEFKYEADVADGESLYSQFGLDRPRRHVLMKLSSGSTVEFKVGNNAPVGYSTYVATNKSTKVLSGSQYIAASLSKSLFDLRDKSVFKISPVTISNFSYQSEKTGIQNLVLEKSGETWKIDKKIDGDTIAIMNLLSDFSDIKASEFLDQVKSIDELKMNGKPSSILATLSLQDEPETKIRLIKRGDERIIYYSDKGSQKFAKIAADNEVKLLKGLEDLRNKKVFSFAANAISEVDIDSVAYKKAGEKWLRSLSSDQKSSNELESPFVSTLLIDLEHAKAERVLDSFEKSKTPPKHMIEMDKSLQSKLTIQAWEGDNDQFVIKHSASQNFFVIKKGLLSSVSPSQTSDPIATLPKLEDLGPPPSP
jgi:hypothetical protein